VSLKFEIADQERLCKACGMLIEPRENCLCDDLGLYLHGQCIEDRPLTAQVVEDAR